MIRIRAYSTSGEEILLEPASIDYKCGDDKHRDRQNVGLLMISGSCAAISLPKHVVVFLNTGQPVVCIKRIEDTETTVGLIIEDRLVQWNPDSNEKLDRSLWFFNPLHHRLPVRSRNFKPSYLKVSQYVKRRK